ncbi:unnamed protein product, partial [Ectocarpus sp. 12 AP-2014]
RLRLGRSVGRVNEDKKWADISPARRAITQKRCLPFARKKVLDLVTITTISVARALSLSSLSLSNPTIPSRKEGHHSKQNRTCSVASHGKIQHKKNKTMTHL